MTSSTTYPKTWVNCPHCFARFGGLTKDRAKKWLSDHVYNRHCGGAWYADSKALEVITPAPKPTPVKDFLGMSKRAKPLGPAFE